MLCGIKATRTVRVAGAQLVEVCDEHVGRIDKGLAVAGRVALRGVGILWEQFGPATYRKAKSLYNWYRAAEDAVSEESKTK